MIIESSSLALSAEHEKTQSQTSAMSLASFQARFAEAQTRRSNEAQSLVASIQTLLAGQTSASGILNASTGTLNTDRLNTEDFFGEHFFERFNQRLNESQNLWSEQDYNQSLLKLFEALYKALTGQSAVSIGASLETAASTPIVGKTGAEESATDTASDDSAARSPLSRSGASLELVTLDFSMSRTLSEYECSSFQACGKVQTADGREIDLQLNLTMERSYTEQQNLDGSVRRLEFKDPLVLNFDGAAAELTESSYDFDLDADGEMDSINSLGGNSAYLALDLNEDGIINDGSELFGALSGNGFADLSAYDEDANGWIDEADSVFDDLLLWSQTPAGNSTATAVTAASGEETTLISENNSATETDAGAPDSAQQNSPVLASLAERNIGALYLGAVSTPFELNNANNDTRGRVVSSGLYLSEDGTAGTLQQIDLVV